MTGLPHEDLSDLIKPAGVPDRSAGLADLVGQRRPDGAGLPLQRAAFVAARGPAANAERAADRAKPAPGKMTIYVSPALARRFERYRRRQKGRTNTSVVLEAITMRHDRLGQLLADARLNTSPLPGNLFPPNPNDVRYLGAGPVQLQIAPTPDQLKVLNDLIEQLELAKRSSWIAAVLNDFLPGTKESS